MYKMMSNGMHVQEEDQNKYTSQLELMMELRVRDTKKEQKEHILRRTMVVQQGLSHTSTTAKGVHKPLWKKKNGREMKSRVIYKFTWEYFGLFTDP